MKNEINAFSAFWDIKPTDENLKKMTDVGFYLIEYNEEQATTHYNMGSQGQYVNTNGWKPIGFMPQKLADTFCDFIYSIHPNEVIPVEKVKSYYQCFCIIVKLLLKEVGLI